jgi:hypothetical protein
VTYPVPREPSKWVGIGWLAVLVICLVPILWVAGLLILKAMGVGD